jgi:hypothetical protein
MTDDAEILLVTTLNRELCQSICKIVDDATGDEVYSALIETIARPVTTTALKHLSDQEIQQIALAFNRFFECSGISDKHIRSAIDSTLRHWVLGNEA